MSDDTITGGVIHAWRAAPDLSGDLMVRPDWHEQAACAGADSEVFFPAGDKGDINYARARTICARCPVRETCLMFALENNEVHGFWGGLNPRERRTEKKRRGMTAPTGGRGPSHGTQYAYRLGCRCARCTARASQLRAQYRGREA